MKKTQWLELGRTVRRTLVSYVSLLLFVTMGSALFLGLGWSAAGMENTFEAEFDRTAFHDFSVYFPLGFSEDELDSLRAFDGSLTVEGTYSCYQFFSLSGHRSQTKVTGITESVDRLTVLSGTLPEKENEIAAEAHWAEEAGVKPGDTLVLTHDDDGTAHALSALLAKAPAGAKFENADGMKALKTDTFTVTALVESPAYESFNSSSFGNASDTDTPFSVLLFVPENAFDPLAFTGYTDVLITSEALRAHAYHTEEYLDAAQALKDRLSGVIDPLAQKKNDTVQAAAALFGTSVEAVPCALLTRQENGGKTLADETVHSAESLRWSMAFMLVVIGLLVCYSAVSRLIRDSRNALGTKKALGFTQKEVTLFYLFYTGTASVIGSILGILLSRFVIQPLAVGAMLKMFICREKVFSFSWTEAIGMSLFQIVLIGLVTFLSCFSTLRQNAIELLAGEAPPKARQRFFTRLPLWRRLPLFTRTVINNCLNEKKRVVSTLIGLTGCTALVVCGFGFTGSLQDSPKIHYGEYQLFDTLVFFDPAKGDGSAVRQALEEKGLSALPVNASTVRFSSPDNEAAASWLFVTDDARLDEFFLLRSPGNKPVSVQDGLSVPRCFNARSGIDAGDPILLTDNRGREKSVTVGSVHEQYVISLSSFISPDQYESVFGEKAANNAFLVRSDGHDPFAAEEALTALDEYRLTYDFRKTGEEELNAVTGAFTAVSMMYLALSAAMSVLVVLNLLTSFVQEKKRELIVLMINGYPRKRVKRYIYADTILLTCIGIVLGCLLGVWGGWISVDSVSGFGIYMLHRFDWTACLLGLLTTAAFTSVMTLIALRRIDRFRLTEASS